MRFDYITGDGKTITMNTLEEPMSVYTTNLRSVVQIRMHDMVGADDDPKGRWWKSIAGFVSHARAEDYADDCRKFNPRKEYRVIDL